MLARVFGNGILNCCRSRARFSVKNHIYNWDKKDFGRQASAPNQYELLPLKDGYNSDPLERQEVKSYIYAQIESRLLKVCSHFDKINLATLNWQGDLQQDLGLDSLERIALLTSIEHEFKTLWEDRVFDNLKSLGQIADELHKDPTIY